MNPNQMNSSSIYKIILAVGLSVLFLSVYQYFFPKENVLPKSENTQSVQNLDKKNLAQAPTELKSMTAQSTATPEVGNTVLPGDTIVNVYSKHFDMEIDSLGRIKQVYLKDKRFNTQQQKSLFAMIGEVFGYRHNIVDNTKHLALLDQNSVKPLEVRFQDEAINQQAFLNAYTTSSPKVYIDDKPVEIELIQNLGSGKTIKKILTIRPNLNFDVKVEVSDANLEYFITNGARPIANDDKYVFMGNILKNSGGTIEKISDLDKVEQFSNVLFSANVDRYFSSILYTLDKNGFNVFVDGKNPVAFISMSGNSALSGYIGAKDYKELKSIYEPLGDVVEYGMITFFAKPLFFLLEYLYGVFHNWGWSIVFLTIIVRLVLYPLSYKGMMSMQKLKDLAPKMKEIQTQYKGDPQKIQKHMMDLYKKHGANPLGGCLPLLLQIPVFFAIYKVLYGAVELKSSAWMLWIHDLSAIDPYYVLPVFMGVSMYVSQLLTPSTFSDPMQEKIFKLLPLVFTIFFIVFPFPAGLVLYWSVNNIISILQQLLINKIIANKKKIGMAF